MHPLFCYFLPANKLDDSVTIEELQRFIDERYLQTQRNMSLVSEDSITVKDNKPKPSWPSGINDAIKPSPSKTAHVESRKSFTNKDVDLFKSINERLVILDILDNLREDINALCASLDFSQRQIDDLRKENTVLKGTVDYIHGKVEVVQRENKQLKETLLDVQCRSMRDNLIFSGIPDKDNSRSCEDTVNSTETAH
jgi:FtsZ-binding cell division protein ZapB